MSHSTPNPWIAVEAAADRRAHSQRLRRAHEAGVMAGCDPPRGVRGLVAESWRRSRAAGVAPDAGGAPLELDGDALEAARALSGLLPVVPTILATVHELGGDAEHVVAIGDAQANLLWVSGDPDAVERAEAMRFQEGAAWSEAAAGTNAVGTALALDHAVQIFSAEHVLEAVHAWTCSAAPIHDPASGRLLGIVDLTAHLGTAHPHTLSLATLAARAAEAELRLLAFRAKSPTRTIQLARQRRRRPRLRLRFLGPRPSARLGGETPERALRSLEVLGVLAMNRGGLTAEQLALALYGERGKTVTVRAQIHRVRAQLGEATLDTQPYRLTVPLEADWLEVTRLVAAGQPDAALRAYPGALLAASEAPMIVEARGLLEESLRRSVLTTGDPELLSRWLAHPAGHDDLAAARALVARLRPGDPRRAAATATASAIARRLQPVREASPRAGRLAALAT
jgi:hypothetical protein